MIFLWGLLFIFGPAALGMAGLLIVHRWVPQEDRSAHNEVAGFVYAIIGVLYAVLLAFVVIASWERFSEAQVRVSREASVMVSLYRDAQVFPEPFRSDVRAQLSAYSDLVLTEEWPALADGRTSDTTSKAFDRLWHVYHSFAPVTPVDQAWYSESLGRLNDVSELRAHRLLTTRSSIPAILWFVLIVGGLVTVAFAYLFGIPSIRAHALMVAALAGTIGLIIFLVWAFDRPFQGGIRVDPHAFRELQTFERRPAP